MTKTDQVRQALRKLGRATSTEVAWESGVDTKRAQTYLSLWFSNGSVRRVGVSSYHHGNSGTYPYIYEAA